ncbi:hypothetical protein TWF696_002680 [Orbilia brochopaga]|uniref:Uncharacterized protein n=1 Tax=Orbilia brochopaga TaxID=3140254 RepID=A0AAV9U3I7_9PEZI
MKLNGRNPKVKGAVVCCFARSMSVYPGPAKAGKRSKGTAKYLPTCPANMRRSEENAQSQTFDRSTWQVAVPVPALIGA